VSEAGPRRRTIVPGAEHLGQVQHLTEETAQRLIRLIEDSRPIRTLRASQILSGFLGAIGFALFIVGVENAAQDVPVVSNAYGSIGVGILLLALTGLLLKQLASRE
jgi:hypothetical protein